MVCVEDSKESQRTKLGFFFFTSIKAPYFGFFLLKHFGTLFLLAYFCSPLEKEGTVRTLTMEPRLPSAVLVIRVLQLLNYLQYVYI